MDYQKMLSDKEKLINLLKEKGVFKQITLKKIKTEIGHDLAGYYCDIHLKGYGNIGYLNDDGYGGDVSPVYLTKEKQLAFETFLKDNNIAQLMLDNGWGFMKTVDKIDFNCQAGCIVEMKLNTREDEKFEKKRTKATEKGIIYGTENSYKSFSYKKTLKEIVLIKGGREHIQNNYNKAKRGLKKGEEIFNTNLKELGIKL